MSIGSEIKKRMAKKVTPATPDFHGEGFGEIINEKTGEKYYPKSESPLKREIKRRMRPRKKKELKEKHYA